MRVKDIMTKEVITADVRTPIMEALQIMKENRIKCLPITKKDRFAGLVTRAMLRDASPSEASSLSVHEMNYLLFKMNVGHIMVKDPVTATPDMPIEEAVWLGRQKGFGKLPVLEDNRLVGIITESDITGVLINALGVGETDSRRITIDAKGRRYGYLKDLVEVMDRHRIPILSLMGIPKPGRADWNLILRVKAKDAGRVAEDLKAKGFVLVDMT